MLCKPRIRLNNLKSSLRFPCLGLNPIIDSINILFHQRMQLRLISYFYLYFNSCYLWWSIVQTYIELFLAGVFIPYQSQSVFSLITVSFFFFFVFFCFLLFFFSLKYSELSIFQIKVRLKLLISQCKFSGSRNFSLRYHCLG